MEQRPRKNCDVSHHSLCLLTRNNLDVEINDTKLMIRDVDTGLQQNILGNKMKQIETETVKRERQRTDCREYDREQKCCGAGAAPNVSTIEFNHFQLGLAFWV